MTGYSFHIGLDVGYCLSWEQSGVWRYVKFSVLCDGDHGTWRGNLERKPGDGRWWCVGFMWKIIVSGAGIWTGLVTGYLITRIPDYTKDLKQGEKKNQDARNRSTPLSAPHSPQTVIGIKKGSRTSTSNNEDTYFFLFARVENPWYKAAIKRSAGDGKRTIITSTWCDRKVSIRSPKCFCIADSESQQWQTMAIMISGRCLTRAEEKCQPSILLLPIGFGFPKRCRSKPAPP